MSRRLRSGVPRAFSSHAGIQGHRYRTSYAALELRYGPFDPVTRGYASGVVVLGMQFQDDTIALETAEHARQHGKGRRPNAGAIARLRKRLALDWNSYDTALRRLEELAGKRQTDPHAAVRAAVARANGQ